MAAASRLLGTALPGARFASGLLRRRYTTNWDTTCFSQRYECQSPERSKRS
jgi:hypothetical protein